MAEIMSRNAKHGLRVDLTPMVDLGFILITFFMFTTTMSKPMAMQLQMPYVDDSKIIDPSPVKRSTAMTILLDRNHHLFYYFGFGDGPSEQIRKSQFSDNGGIRDVIMAKKTEVRNSIARGILEPDDKMTVIIKATPSARTADLVNILDEMSINKIPVFTVVDITTEDLAKIENFQE